MECLVFKEILIKNKFGGIIYFDFKIIYYKVIVIKRI